MYIVFVKQYGTFSCKHLIQVVLNNICQIALKAGAQK